MTDLSRFWRQPVERRVAAASVAALILFGLLLLVPLSPQWAFGVIAPVLTVITRVLGAIGGLFVYNRTRLPRALRDGFLMLALAQLSFAGGDLLWFTLEIGAGVDPGYHWPSLFYVGFYPLALVALLHLPHGFLRGSSRASFMLDTWMVLVAVGYMCWQGLIVPAMESLPAHVGALKLGLALFYPTADVVVLTAAITVATHLPRGTLRHVAVLFGLGLLPNLVADLYWIVATLNGDKPVPGRADVLWFLGALLFGLAAWRAVGVRTAEVVAGYGGGRPGGVGIGAIAAVVGVGLMLMYLTDRTVEDALIFAACALVLVGLLHGSMRDLTWRREQQLRQEQAKQERLAAVVDLSPDGLLVLDGEFRVVYASRVAAHMLGVPRDRLLRTPLVNWVHPADCMLLVEDMVRATLRRLDRVLSRWRLAPADGSLFWVEASIADCTADPEIGGLVVSLKDVRERHALEQRLLIRSQHDELTGLANRTLLRTRIEQMLASHARAEQGFAILVFDIDNFKSINDGLGHGCGDQLLRALAERLTAALLPGETAARLGGDEFAVTLPATRDAHAAHTRAVALTQRLSGSYQTAQGELGVSLSAGLALARPDADPDGLLDEADIAMYEAKRHGGNRVQAFDLEIERLVRWRNGVREKLIAALEHNGFRMAYQPLIATRDGSVYGVEALLRWTDPKDKPPIAALIAEAETCGLILPLGRKILRLVLNDLRQMLTGAGPAFQVVTINLSWQQLDDPEFVNQLAAELQQSGVPASRILLELTETSAPSLERQHFTRLAALRELGVGLALDDFGTGNTSFASLQELDLRLLKLPQSLVRHIERDQRVSELAGAMLSFATQLQLATVAEGVETLEQFQWLREQGCAYVQGHLFAPALPPERVVSWQPPDPSLFAPRADAS